MPLSAPCAQGRIVMRWLIDTNVLISAVLFPDSVPAKAYMMAVSLPHHAVVCNYSLDEMRRVYSHKFPTKTAAFERFAALLALSVEIVATPENKIQDAPDEQKIRDMNGRPIFRAASAAKVDGIITGDKDFLESGIIRPEMISPAEFIRKHS